MTKKETKKKSNKDWETMEKIVYALEKFTSVDYQVERNIKLPVTGRSTKRKRQVDVLITATNGAKVTRYMVEVQKRKSKVDINTFHGWIKKMRSVDCQHLICVSTKGFPKTVVEDIEKEYGKNTVTLMTLNDFDTLVNPETLVNIDLDIESFRWALQNKRWDYIDGTAPVLEESSRKLGTELLLKYNEVFFVFNGKKCAFNEMCEFMVTVETDKPDIRKMLQDHESHDFHVHFKEKDNLFLVMGEEKFRVMSWDFTIRVKVTPIRFNAESKKLAYRHVFEDNTLAWICSTTFTYDQMVQKDDNTITMEVHSIQVDFVCKLVDGKMKWRIHEHGIQKVV